MERRRIVQIFLPLLILLGYASHTFADAAENLYSTVIQVPDNTMATRNQHLPIAFEQVIKKVASSHQVLLASEYLEAREHPDRFISHYSYLDHENAYALRLRFNEAMINNLLHKIGRATLGKNREQILLWVVQDDPKNPVFIANGPNDIITKKISSLAANYGVPIMLPLLDLTERLFISEQDILSTNIQPLQLAAQRYSTDSMLLGKIKHEGDLWSCDWHLVVNQQQITWHSVSNNLDAELEAMINNLADKLITIQQSMQQKSGDAAQNIVLRIKGVSTVNDYAKVVDHLKRLHTVKQVEIGAVSGTYGTFIIQADGGSKQVLHDLRMSNFLIVDPQTAEDNENSNNLDLIYRATS